MKPAKQLLLSSLFLILAIFAPSDVAAQGTVEENARKVLEDNKPALVVVTVKGKLTATTSGDPLPDRDQQRRTLGVTIGDNGLVVVSNSAIDAAVGLAGQQAKVDSKVVKIQAAKTEFSEVEISYGDSTLLHGKVVRQDVDADVEPHRGFRFSLSMENQWESQLSVSSTESHPVFWELFLPVRFR